MGKLKYEKMRKSSRDILPNQKNITLMQKCWTIWNELIKNKRNIYHMYTQNGQETAKCGKKTIMGYGDNTL